MRDAAVHLSWLICSVCFDRARLFSPALRGPARPVASYGWNVKHSFAYSPADTFGQNLKTIKYYYDSCHSNIFTWVNRGNLFNFLKALSLLQMFSSSFPPGSYFPNPISNQLYLKTWPCHCPFIVTKAFLQLDFTSLSSFHPNCNRFKYCYNHHVNLIFRGSLHASPYIHCLIWAILNMNLQNINWCI